MYLFFRRHLLQPVAASAILLAVLAVVPLLASVGSDFLGRDVSGLATSIVSYYPWYFVRELLKIALLSFLALLSVSVLFQAVGRRVPVRIWAASVFPGLPVLVITLLIFSSLYEYPALYDGILAAPLQKLIFRTADYVNPVVVRGAIFILIASALAFVFWKDRQARKYIAAALGIGICVGGYLFLRAMPTQTSPGKSPHILMIAIDSLRTDHVDPDTMPALAELLNDKATINFRNHYIGVPRTFPSWVELLFARNAPSTSVRHMFPGFADRRQATKSLPTVLSEHGYSSAVVSDFAGDIFPRFDSGFDVVRAPSMNLRGLIELAVHQKFPLFLPFTTLKPFDRFFPVLVQNPAFADPKKLVRQFSELPDPPTGMPWFTTIFFSTAHFPYAAPYPYYRKDTAVHYSGPFYFQKNPDLSGIEMLTEDNIRQTRGLYKGALAAIDASVREIFERLKQSGAWDNTIIVVTGDHGEDLYEHGRLQGHGEHLLGQNVIKVPFVLRVPGRDFSGVSPVSFVTRSIDVGPTIAGAAGIDWKNTQGINLFPWIEGNDAQPSLIAYSETGLWFSANGRGEFQKQRLSYPGISGLLDFDHGMSQEIVLNPEYEKMVSAAKHRSIVRGDYKLIYVPTETEVKFLLFNEKSDPENLSDLAVSEPDILSMMKSDFFATVRALEPKSVLIGNYIVRQ